MRLQPVGRSASPAQMPSALDTLTVRDALPGGVADPLLDRYQAECAFFLGVPGLRHAAAVLLGAHAAGGFLWCLPALERQRAGGSALGETCVRLAGGFPGRDVLAEAWRTLRAPEDAAALDEAAAGQTELLWPLAGATEQLLVQGGDERLSLDPASGLNRYGCAPRPEPGVAAFGSCTASNISAAAFAAAEAARRALVQAAVAQSPNAALEGAMRAAGAALLGYCGLEGAAEAALVASGTDAALLVTALVAARQEGRAVTSILMSPSETGSGVPVAVRGRHFSSSTASGGDVPKGAALAGLPETVGLHTIPLRDGQGRPVPQAEVTAACEAAVAAVVERGGHAVLHAIDGSKTGLAAPDRASLRRLAARFGTRLTIVVDACQMRLEPGLVRGAVDQGFVVLVTGSKFFSAPGFCGAVLVPAHVGAPAFGTLLPAGLDGYATASGGTIGRRCPGLLLRWTAALHSMGRFARVPADAVRDAIDRMGAGVRAALMRDERLRLVAAPRPAGLGWSGRSSIVTFAVRASADGPWLSAEALRPLYLGLADGAGGSLRCQIGQPVTLGAGGPGYAAVGGLRIAFSADQLAAEGTDRQALPAVFAKLGLLLDRWPAGEPPHKPG